MVVPLASVSAAYGPRISISVWPPDSSTTPACTSASASRSRSSQSWQASSSVSNSHSVGPIQQAMMPLPAAWVFGVVGNATPSTLLAAAVKAWSSLWPRREMWPRNGRSRRVTLLSPREVDPRTASGRPTSGLSCFISDILTCSFRIIKDGAGDFGLDHAAVGLRRTQHFAVAFVPAADHGQGNGMAQCGAVIARGHIAFHGHGRLEAWIARVRRLGDQLRAFGQHSLGIGRAQADELAPILAHDVRALERALADEVFLLLADGPVHAHVHRRHGAVGVLAGDDKALFGAQDMHGFSAIRRDAIRLARRHDRFPDMAAVIGVDVDLKRQLA